MKQKLLPNKARFLAVLLIFLLFTTSALAQKNVTGKVTNASDNLPVSGATVAVRGTKVATTTGTDGAFSISVPAGRNTLVISFIGFEETVVDVSNRHHSYVVMRERTGGLSEVVVTGYSSQRKKDIIGAVSVVDIADLKSTPAANLGAQLQGRATGVTVSGSAPPAHRLWSVSAVFNQAVTTNPFML
ncbi:MAG: hypothetical protein HC867_07725 [Bacteroidia bacterium]|nr:hypothetical protein [Bacteroidia bacterium]